MDESPTWVGIRPSRMEFERLFSSKEDPNRLGWAPIFGRGRHSGFNLLR
jgi:hypothetical protein